eukprot:1389463-Rhodomonas_salina.1
MWRIREGREGRGQRKVNKEQALAGLVGESRCEMVFWVEWGEVAEKWEFSVTVSSVVVLSVGFCRYKWP